MKIIFDTETTGLLLPLGTDLAKQPECIQLFAILIDDNFTVVDEYFNYFKPKNEIPASITRLTGIKQNQCVINFSDEKEKILEFFKKADTIVAHNLYFDMQILKNEFAKNGIDIEFKNWKQVDTVFSTKELLGFRLTLDKLAEYLKIPLTSTQEFSRHDARGDVFLLKECYKKLVEDGII
jgi:DNA polymerase III alpha subunit (gram-positive type)